MPHKHICEYCGKHFEAPHKIRRFCSYDCFLLGRGPVWNKGKKMSKEGRKKISEGNKRRFKDPVERLKISLTHKRGDHDEGYKKQAETLRQRYASGEIKPWNKGLTKHDDPRLIVSEKTKKKKSKISKQKWKDPEYRYKVVTRSLKALFGKRPTNLESKFINLIQKYNLSFKYVGDGGLVINGCCPDFVGIEDPTLLIEVANRVIAQHPKNYDLKRYSIFARHGYRTATIWEEYLDGPDWEEKTLFFLAEKQFIKLPVAVCRASLRAEKKSG